MISSSLYSIISEFQQQQYYGFTSSPFLGTTIFLVMKISIVTVGIVLIGIWYFIRPFPISTALPGPKRSKFWGVTFQEESNECFGDAGEIFQWNKWPTLSLQLSRRYDFCTWGGPTLNIGFGGAFFNVVSPQCLQYILKDNFSNYEKGKLTESFRELMGSAVFTTDGNAWKFHRKIVTTILSKETVRHAAILMKKKLYKVEQVLLQRANDDSIFDFQDLCYKIVFDVFAKLAFGVELNQVDNMKMTDNNNNSTSSSSSDSDHHHQQQQQQQQQQKKMDEFTDAFDRLQYYTHLRFNDVLWQIKQKYSLGDRERKVIECQKIIDDFAFGIIRKALATTTTTTTTATTTGSGTGSSGSIDGDGSHKAAEEPQPQPQDSVVHKFIQYCRNQNNSNNNKDPSEQELRDFVMTFVLAGRDTTSVALAWTIYELTKHPTVVDCIREEVDRLLLLQSSSQEQQSDKDDDDESCSCWTYEFVDKLTYTQAVVMEALRLHSPAPDNFRFSINDDKLPDGTIIPAGSLVMYSIYTINHSDKVWGETADVFNPNRFLTSTTTTAEGGDRREQSYSCCVEEPSSTKYPTFNTGPRLCPGKPLALMELKMAVAFLTSKFDFQDISQHSGDFDWKLVLAMKDGFPVKVTPRK